MSSGACSDLFMGWPSIAVSLGSAHFPILKNITLLPYSLLLCMHYIVNTIQFPTPPALVNFNMYKLVKSTWQSTSLPAKSEQVTFLIFSNSSSTKIMHQIKKSINIKRCCILGSTTLYSKIQKLQKFRLESCLKKFSQFLVPASTVWSWQSKLLNETKRQYM